MCGIVGVINSNKYGFDFKDAEAFETMLFLDTLRGWDSTGVFGVTNEKDVYLAKDAVHGADFICTKEFKDIRGKMISRGSFFVGHNRAATRGTVVDKNAHPFCIDDKIILVQNGTMRGDHKKHKDVEVDTEALAHVISDTDNIGDALNKINASYALVWYNTKTHSLQIVRNTERPLFIAETEKGNIFFASEANTILYATAKHDIKLSKKPYMLHENVLLTYKLNDDKSWEEDITEIEIKPKEVTVTQANFSQLGLSGFGEDRYNHPFAHGYSDKDNVIMGAVRVVASNKPSVTEEGRYYVKTNLIETLINNFPVYHVEEQMAHETMNAFNALNEVTVELVDYIPLNNHKDCRVYHVYGTDVNPNGLDIIYHWIERDLNELQTLEMCGRFYTVKPSTLMQRMFKNPQNQTRYLLTAYGMQHRLIGNKVMQHVH